jgi:hypothetical protein
MAAAMFQTFSLPGEFRAAIAACALLGACAAHAATASFQGGLAADDGLAVFQLVLPAAGTLSVVTFSYQGGTNGQGALIPGGGFAPVLNLFDSAGVNVFGDIGSSHTCGGAGSFCWDAFFTLPGTPAGAYTLVLSQDGNNPLGLLADGYSMAGQPNYTAQYLGGTNPSAMFVQVDGTQRSGRWAVDITLAGTVTQVGEPAPAALLVAGLWALAGLHRQRARRTA